MPACSARSQAAAWVAGLSERDQRALRDILRRASA